MQAENLISHRSLDQLETDLVDRAARMNAEEYAFLCDVREFDVRQGWKAYQFNNCAEWLNWKCQISPGTAREKVRVANQLYCLPLISKAFAQGRISYSKARPLTRIADAENEKELLDYALNRTAFQVEHHCRVLRNAQRDASTADANKIHRSRYLSRSVHDDGSMTINMELPQETGELVMKAIEIAMAAQSQGDHDPNAETDSYQARQCDALVDVARGYLAGGQDKPVRNSDNYTVMVHVDESALAGQGGESDLPIETVRRMTCDCSLLSVLKDKNGEPLNVGRKRRIVPPHIERALCARDKTCRFPGCTHTQYLESHHIIHWADGGETKLSDMMRLCSKHHRLHHEGGYAIYKDFRGKWYFRNADGKVIPEAPVYRAAASNDFESEPCSEVNLVNKAGLVDEDESVDASRDGQEQDSLTCGALCNTFTNIREPLAAYGY